jgi:hypothetical protein
MHLPTSARSNVAPVCFPTGTTKTVTTADACDRPRNDNWPMWARLLSQRERSLRTSSGSNAKWGGAEGSDSAMQGWVVFVQSAQTWNVQSPRRSGQVAVTECEKVKTIFICVFLAFFFSVQTSAQSAGHVDTSLETCDWKASVYVYSTPYANTQKPLGFLEDGTKLNIASKHLLKYYLVDSDTPDGTHLHGYVPKGCVMIDFSSEEVERRQEPAPVLRSGLIRVFPLNLGDTFAVTIGNDTRVCTAKSIKDLDCPVPLPSFQAVMASQGGHEYLIGCQWRDLDTCVALGVGLYSVLVHDRTITVLHSGWATVNTKTGKRIADITPVFTVLTLVK